jgi:ABC-type multidrug transport system fused ATPase/permease subunit
LTRCLAEQAGIWRIWLPLLILTAILPFVILAMPLVQKTLIDDVLLGRRLDLLPGTVGLYALLWLVSTAGGIVRSGLSRYLTERVAQHFRQRLFVHHGFLSLAFARREHNGQVMSLIQNDVAQIAGLFGGTVIAGVGKLVGVAVGIALMFSLSWQLALAAGLAPPILGALGTLITGPFRPMSRRVQEKVAELTERLQEYLDGIREVAAFGREGEQAARYAQAIRELIQLRMRLVMMDSVFQAGQSAFSLVVSIIILGFGGYLYLRGNTTIGSLVAIQSIFGMTFLPSTDLIGMVKDVQVALASAERVYAFLDARPDVQDPPVPVSPAWVEGVVAFERVSFAYRPGQPVLRDVSLAARPGEVVALVGPSGAGKSTLMSLLARFYDPADGRILLDGVDLRDLRLADLRRAIGIVFQDTFLFAASVRENIAFGRPGATEDEIVAAARAANAWEFIEGLPSGLDTPVGQRGVQLSEGQRQRVAIARAFLRDPRILILDEPTSALDARAEHMVQAALDNLMRGRTTFVIAHRLATIRRADQIAVLDQGRVVERGTHAELLRRSGLYRELFELQFGRLPTSETPVTSPGVVAAV